MTTRLEKQSRPVHLTLIGTIHNAPRGIFSLWKLLKHLAPVVISVEIAPWSLAWRDRLADRLRERFWSNISRLHPELINTSKRRKLIQFNGSLRAVLLQMAVPYEWRAAERYGRLFDIPIIPVESNTFIRPLFPHVRRLVTMENLDYLIGQPVQNYQEMVELELETAREAIRQRHVGPTMDPDREQYLAQRIRECAMKLASGQMVHIGGWEHLVPTVGHLPDLLHDLNPDIKLIGVSGNTRECEQTE